MITVKFSRDDETISLKMIGHALCGKSGNDLVCASASTLAYTIAQYVLMMTKDNMLLETPTIVMEEGLAHIECKPKATYFNEAEHAFLVVEIGFCLLQENYPQAVDVTPFDTAK